MAQCIEVTVRYRIDSDATDADPDVIAEVFTDELSQIIFEDEDGHDWTADFWPGSGVEARTLTA